MGLRERVFLTLNRLQEVISHSRETWWSTSHYPVVQSILILDPVPYHKRFIRITFDPPADWFDSQNLVECSLRGISTLVDDVHRIYPIILESLILKYCDNGFGFECRLTSSVRLSVQSAYDRRFWRGKVVPSSSLRRFCPQRSLPQYDWRRFQNKNDQTRWEKDSSSSLGYR